MFGKCLENVKKTAPLVHNITNYVTVNDVANVLLACGGSPIMSDELEDVADITSICGGLNINIGTLNKRSIEGMFIAGAKANELGHIVLLDPVGAGASRLRTNTAVELMEKLGLKSRQTFRKNYLQPALEAGLIGMTNPDQPTNRNQRYFKI